MAYSNEVKKLRERFPNKNVGSGNPDAFILFITKKVGNEEQDYKHLQRLFRNLPFIREGTNLKDCCYYVLFDEELLTDSFFDHFRIILYTYINGSQLQHHDPANLFEMRWIPECTIQDGGLQRLFVAHSKKQEDIPERVLFCTYPLEKVSDTIMRFYKAFLNWFYYIQVDINLIQENDKDGNRIK